MTFIFRRSQSGVSLVEALVALAVMAIGMLGIVGVQSTLRSNSDNAKQRAEAVRHAQQGIEEWRGFVSLNPNLTAVDYQELLAPTIPIPWTPDGNSNTTYERLRSVQPLPAPPGGLSAGLSLVSDVTWVDRTGANHAVRLSTVIARIDPELPATLVVPVSRDTLRQPGGRHRGIPTAAKYLNPAFSAMIPPNAPTGVAWRFDNVTAFITLCTTSVTSTAALETANLTCSTDRAFLVAGFIRYALTQQQPTAADANSPPSLPLTQGQVGLEVERTYPESGSSPFCFFSEVATPSPYTEYFCAVPVVVVENDQTRWSGRIRFTSSTSLVAATLADNNPLLYKVCRYHAAPTYVDVKTALLNQNFLVIPAGGVTMNNAVTFVCPDPPTKPHQPAS